MKSIYTQNAPKAIGPYSQAVVVDGMIFTSGQIALNRDGDFCNGDIVEQTKQVFENLKAILESEGSGLESVIKTTVFLSRGMEDFAPMNEVYEGYFGSHKPARSTVVVKQLPKDALVEIECVAKIG